VTIELPFIEY